MVIICIGIAANCSEAPNLHHNCAEIICYVRVYPKKIFSRNFSAYHQSLKFISRARTQEGQLQSPWIWNNFFSKLSIIWNIQSCETDHHLRRVYGKWYLLKVLSWTKRSDWAKQVNIESEKVEKTGYKNFTRTQCDQNGWFF